jgi:hypothetical protein
MFKGTFVKLILGSIILIFSYAFPIFMIPIGSYSYSSNNTSYEYSFQWNGKVEKEITIVDESTTISNYYKISDKVIYKSSDKDAKIENMHILAQIKNIYTIEIGGEEYQNSWAFAFAIAGFVLTGWGFIGLVIKKKK